MIDPVVGRPVRPTSMPCEGSRLRPGGSGPPAVEDGGWRSIPRSASGGRTCWTRGRSSSPYSITPTIPTHVVVGYLVLDVNAPSAGSTRSSSRLRHASWASEMRCSGRRRGGPFGGRDGVEGQALPGDRETKNLYERAGITARLITGRGAWTDEHRF